MAVNIKLNSYLICWQINIWTASRRTFKRNFKKWISSLQMNWLRNIYNVCWGRITWGSSFETEGTFGSIESWKRQERHRKRGLQIACVSFTLYFHDIWQKDSKLFGEWPSSLHWRFLKVDFSLEFPSLPRIRKPILHCESFLRLSPVFWNIRTKEHKILELKTNL